MASPKFETQFNWSRRFLPEMKRIIGEHLIAEAPAEEDMQRNTDLVVLRLDVIRVACRVRKYQYLDAYGDEFTIRSGVASGAQTELTKVISGWGQYVLYGFSDPDEESLAAWMLGDLNVFRLEHQRAAWRNQAFGIARSNGDGSSFMAFRIDEMPCEFVVARKRAVARAGVGGMADDVFE